MRACSKDYVESVTVCVELDFDEPVKMTNAAEKRIKDAVKKALEDLKFIKPRPSINAYLTYTN